MITRILVPGRVLPAGRAGRHEAVATGLRYLDAVERAGGVPLVVAPRPLDPAGADALLGIADGLLLTGGADVDPTRYGAERAPETYGVDAARDHAELALLAAALRAARPVLAICRGMQLLNVAFGGSLQQHISDGPVLPRRPDGFPAPPPGSNGPLVEVHVRAGTRLAAAIGSPTVLGAHAHHQAIDRVGAGLIVSAVAADGIVEGIEPAETNAPWVVGVQWHPEDTAAHDPANQRLFDAFVAVALATGVDATR